MNLADTVVLFAQQPPPGGVLGSFLLPLVMIGILFFFMFLQPQKREQQARDQMLKALKKNDRVLTTGGIFGVVTNIQVEANEATLRIDEKNDTKMRVQLSSIARVLAEGDPEEAKTDKS